MKKILSILLLFASIITLTACESDEYDKSIYVADDHSYLMIHGVKYIRVDGLPISQTDMDRQTIQFKGRIPDSLQKIWDYTGAQRYPWIGLFDEDFYMKDAVLPNGIMIKFVEYAGTYCLPEDLEEVLSLFEDFKWSSDKAGLYLIDPNISYQLSDSLSKYILNSVENNAKKNVDRIVKDRHFLSEVGVVYDSKLCVEKQFYRVCFFSENEVYLFPINLGISSQYKDGSICIPLSEAGDYRVSEEYREELIAAFREAYKDEGKEIFWPE